LHGLDLFNHGYYWEAHEVWEDLWKACGRTGPTACFLKGLIQLAVAGVKVRQARPRAVRDHAHRAAELFEQAGRDLGTGMHLGLVLSELIRWANEAGDGLSRGGKQPEKDVEVVFNFVLRPG
jgi:predicted metal-dependent hydrolase